MGAESYIMTQRFVDRAERHGNGEKDTGHQNLQAKVPILLEEKKPDDKNRHQRRQVEGGGTDQRFPDLADHGRQNEKPDQDRNRDHPMQLQKPAERDQQIEMDEQHDRQDIRHRGPARCKRVKQEGPDPGERHDHDQRKTEPVVRRPAPPESIGCKRRDQEGGVGDRVDRLGPELRPEPFAIDIDALIEIHELVPSQTACPCSFIGQL
jgi:hypothetical protein